MSDELLQHYSQQYRDREVYYLARERARTEGDMLVTILDTYDHAKMCLPAWPLRRTPKRAFYESHKRALLAVSTQLAYLIVISSCLIRQVRNIFDPEGQPQGSNWSIECVPKLNFQENLLTIPNINQDSCNPRLCVALTMPGHKHGR